jgi:pimeloyl-ACP methyl ester carboxylesterase
MATFILVHGTFAKSAHWPILQDRLAETARAAGDQPLFEQLTWTGRNLARARQDAASAIFTSVQRIQRTSTNEKIFIIGHSHGGSAIAYFLKEHPEVAKTLAGCAFLSTPFVAIRPRREPFRLFSTLILFPFIAVQSLLKVWQDSTSPFHGISIEERLAMPIITSAHWFSLFKSLGVLAAIACLAMFFGKRFREWFWGFSEPRNHKMEQWQQTADIPAGNYLFVRCSGDEAAAALSALQFIAWLAMKGSRLLELVTRPFFDLFKRNSYTAAAVLGIVFAFVMGVLANGWIDVLPGILKFGVLGYFFSPDGPFVGKLKHVQLVLCCAQNEMITIVLYTLEGIVDIVYTSVSFVAVSLLLLCLSAVFLIFLTQAVATWAFGWTRLGTGFLVELAIEPLPFGEHSLIHIDWALGSTGSDGIVHSWTHAHPAAIVHLQNWVEASLGKLPMTPAETTTFAAQKINGPTSRT